MVLSLFAVVPPSQSVSLPPTDHCSAAAQKRGLHEAPSLPPSPGCKHAGQRLPLHRPRVSKGTFQKGTRWPFSLPVVPPSVRPTVISFGRPEKSNKYGMFLALFIARSLSLSPRGRRGGKTACLLSSPLPLVQLARPQFYLLQCCRAVVNVTRNLAADVGSREEKIWSSRQAGINLCYSQSVRK